MSSEADTSPPVIVAEGLWKRYGEMVAVEDMSLEVRPGAIFALLGPNGAGKTTTINMLTTLLPIDEGRASIAGVDVAEHPEIVRGLIGLAGQSAAVDERLTARENLDLFGRLYKIPGARTPGSHDRTDRALSDERLCRPAREHMLRRRAPATGCGRQSHRGSAGLFLDEPTTGLDPRSRVELWEEIRGLAQQGAAVVLTTQYLEEADQLADQIAVIDKGVVVASGTARRLKDDLERDVLEVRLKTQEDREIAAAALASVGTDFTADGEGMVVVDPRVRRFGLQPGDAALHRRLGSADRRLPLPAPHAR